MDFFEAQDRARRKTTLLVVYFILAIILMVTLIYCAVVGALSFTFKTNDGQPAIDWVQPELFLIVAGVTLLIILVGSLFKTAELRSGGEAVALMLGGRRIPPTTTDPEQRRVLNVVEEMAIASGVAVPPVFLLRNEASVNAFAAGHTADDAVIGISNGALEYLSRDELQGVIAHEYSHILNGDMRFNLRLVGILHGILLISIIGYHLLRVQGRGVRVSRDKGSGGGQIMMIGLATLVIGYVGLVFGRLIKAAVSRQREFLADASAVQFTRNPDTISGALKKIGGLEAGSTIGSPHAETASHMFFGDAFRRWAHSPFATHPPLSTRIQRLEPGFDGVYPKVTPQTRDTPAETTKTEEKGETTKGRLPIGRVLGELGLGDRIPLDPALVIASVGAPTTQHVDQSKKLIELIPGPLEEATREPFSARAFLFALLLDADPTIQQQQLDAIQSIEGVETRAETLRLAKHVDAVPAAARLPALEIVQSTLRELSERQYKQFRKTIDSLVEADQRISLFEFVLQRIIIRHLDRTFQLTRPSAVQYHSIKAVAKDITVLASAVAYLGHSDEEAAKHAFGLSMASMDRNAEAILPKAECGLRQIDRALSRVNVASAAIKKRVLTALAICIAADRHVTVKEAELFRAVATSIDCPVPPIVGSPIR